MAFVLRYIYGLIYDIFENYKDPRVQNLPLIGSPLPMLVVITAYLAFVLHYGPKWMEKREPFNLNNVMRVYNAIQVIANTFLFVYGLPNSYFRKEFSLTCQPIDHTNTEPWMWNLIYISYGYCLTKYLDLFDTIFFVLRKKKNQITFLHVYHHAGMIFGVYIFMTFLAGSHGTMLGVINLFIHTVMYSYYFVTSVWPVKRAIWWKRYITQLQLLQFGYLTIHFLMAIVLNDCKHPILISFIGVTQNVFMFALFFEFYYKEYVRKPKLLVQRKQQTTPANQEQSMQSTELTKNVHLQHCREEFEQFEKMKQAIVIQANEQLNSLRNSAGKSQLHILPTHSLLKTKCS